MTVRRNVLHAPAIRFAEGDVAVIAALFGCAGLHAGRPLTEGLVLLVVAAHAAGLGIWLGPALGVTAWAFVTGFVVHDLGVLTFRDPDLVRLGLFVLVGLGAALLAKTAGPTAARVPAAR